MAIADLKDDRFVRALRSSTLAAKGIACYPKAMAHMSDAVSDVVDSFVLRLDALVNAEVERRLNETLASLRAGLMARDPAPAAPRFKPAPRLASAPRFVPAPPTRPQPPPAILVELPKARTATVLPPGVKITRLPPGPVPRGPRQSSPETGLCRLPGCPNRHSGPRYDLFCRDHYGTLSAAERQKYKAMWKAAHALA